MRLRLEEVKQPSENIMNQSLSLEACWETGGQGWGGGSPEATHRLLLPWPAQALIDSWPGEPSFCPSVGEEVNVHRSFQTPQSEGTGVPLP